MKGKTKQNKELCLVTGPTVQIEAILIKPS